MKSSLLCCLLTLLTIGLRAQEDPYTPPIQGPLLVTGTFGELRSNHFHGGLDFRAAVGTPVYAVNEGYVSRIKISGGGYGQAIYIDHPDGKRSVYGHLELLTPELEDTIRALQYERESFEIDLKLQPDDFPVIRGQRIGGVGNRGFSFGPHLHFEIRETAGDVPLNPLSLGFTVPDTRVPELRNLRIYELSDAGDPLRTTTYDLTRRSLPDTIRVGTQRIGLGFKAYDRQNGMPNRNGIYRARLEVDTTEQFSFTYDRIPYEKTEYLNALTDYADWQRNSSWYYLLYAQTPAAVFWSGGAPSSDGVLQLQPGVPREVTVTVADYAGNETRASAVLLYQEDLAPAAPQEPVYTYYLPTGEPSIIDTGGMRLELDKDALYRDLKFRYTRLTDDSDDHLSDTHLLHEETTALHGWARLSLRPLSPVPASLRPRVYVGKCDAKGRYSSVGGVWQKDGTLATRIRSFGNYALLVDSLPPTVRIKRFGTDLRGVAAFSLLIDDNIGGDLDYRGTVDGEWVLMEYDAKSGRLTHTFVGNRIATDTRHRFELRVSDERGNETTFVRYFRR